MVNDWIYILLAAFLGIGIGLLIIWAFTRALRNLIFIASVLFSFGVSLSKVYNLNFLEEFQGYHELLIAAISGYFVGLLIQEIKEAVSTSEQWRKIIALQFFANIFRVPALIIVLSSILRYLYGINDIIEYKYILIVVIADLTHTFSCRVLKKKKEKIGVKDIFIVLSFEFVILLSAINLGNLLYHSIGWFFIENFSFTFMGFTLFFLSFCSAYFLGKIRWILRRILFTRRIIPRYRHSFRQRNRERNRQRNREWHRNRYRFRNRYWRNDWDWERDSDRNRDRDRDRNRDRNWDWDWDWD